MYNSFRTSYMGIQGAGNSIADQMRNDIVTIKKTGDQGLPFQNRKIMKINLPVMMNCVFLHTQKMSTKEFFAKKLISCLSLALFYWQ
ncbi:MAG: hypothetical protein ACOC12_04060 [Bacteroidota bacterium]